VTFAATSPHGRVTGMRVLTGGGRCRTLDDMAAVSWEPFVAEKTYRARLALNWIGWYVTVQYRDAHGNVSPVYCDDISLEGHPPQPTSPATPALCPCAPAQPAILLAGWLLRRGQ